MNKKIRKDLIKIRNKLAKKRNPKYVRKSAHFITLALMMLTEI